MTSTLTSKESDLNTVSHSGRQKDVDIGNLLMVLLSFNQSKIKLSARNETCSYSCCNLPRSQRRRLFSLSGKHLLRTVRPWKRGIWQWPGTALGRGRRTPRWAAGRRASLERGEDDHVKTQVRTDDPYSCASVVVTLLYPLPLSGAQSPVLVLQPRHRQHQSDELSPPLAVEVGQAD